MNKSTVVAITAFVFVGIMGVFNSAIADYSIPVDHTHNNRAHKHQLPKEGVHHRHGIGQLGKPIKTKNTVIYSTTTTVPNNPSNNTQNTDVRLHSHAGREHTHPLPNQGVFHRHGVGGQIGQRVTNSSTAASNNNASSTNEPVIYNDTNEFPVNTQPNTSTNSSVNIVESIINSHIGGKKPWGKKPWSKKRGLSKFTKSDVRCAPGQADCNVCAVNVKQQFQKAASKQIKWNRKRWNFDWPKRYPPRNIRPLDIFDGDPAYPLGIPNTHIQGFVRTNSKVYPYAGSHSHKRKGGIFVIKQHANGEQYLSSLHQTSGHHPSGVATIGKYIIYGVGTRLFFNDINSPNQSSGFSMTAEKANFGGGLSIVKLARDNHLLITTGPGGQKPAVRFNRFYHLKSRNGRPVSLTFINQSTTNKPAQWPEGFAFSENMSLISECGTGDVYAVHTTGDGGLTTVAGKGYWRLSKLVHNGKALGLTAVNAFTTLQDLKRCNARSTATVSVNARRGLEFVCHGYAKDPDGSGFNILGKSSRNRDKFYYNVGTVQ